MPDSPLFLDAFRNLGYLYCYLFVIVYSELDAI
jgi:hypothetical protein